MTRPGVLAIAVFVALVVRSPHAQSPTDPQVTFRTATDLVTVDVSVRDGSNAVAGLRAEDFALTDNGVRQTIESLDAARVPLDVSLVVDVSGGSPQWWGKPNDEREVVADLNLMLERTTALLRPDDRIRLLTIDTHVHEIVPLRPAVAAPVLATPLATNGLSSLNDALVTTLLRRVDPGRRHLVVAMTKAEDTISSVELATLQDVARRSDAVLHVVFGDSLTGNTRCVMECMFPRQRFWRPFQRRAEETLSTAAVATGGAFHGYNAFGLLRDFAATFGDIFNDFRRGYVLRYRPQGIRRDGWHDIKVTVPSRPSVVVSARPGYAIEVPAPPERPEPPVKPAGGAPPPATVASVTAAFERRDRAGLREELLRTRDLARLLRDVREAGNPWPAAPRREAVFVLELADVAFSRGDERLQEETGEWLQKYNDLVRQPLGADEFECLWYWAELAVVEGAMLPALGRTLAAKAIERCPGEPRFVLAEAIFVDQRWPLGVSWPGVLSVATPSAEQATLAPALYAKAIALPSVADEARVRGAWFEYRVGRFTESLGMLGPSSAGADRAIQYLRALLRGHILRELDRQDEAAAAYEAALLVWPGAQSARVGLMTLRAAQGRRADAEALALAIETAPDDQFDPWWTYWRGDYRISTPIMDRLREAAR